MNKTRTASARDISRVLNISVESVRYHLRVLMSDGRLTESVASSQDKRGRPEKVYSLPSTALGENLSRLTDALLTEAGSQALMEAVAKRLADECDFVNEPLAKRLNLVVEKLTQMNYHARWEAAAEGPRLIFRHCPYVTIIDRHPELCLMDAALLETLMGQAAKQLTTIRNGSKSCVFVMGR